VDIDQILDPSILVPVAIAVVLLLGVGIAVVKVFLGKRRHAAVERWARGAYAIWTGGEDCATWPAQRAQEALSSWYGAASGGAYLNVLRGLRQGQTGNAAWDKVRALDLVRIGMAATYIDRSDSRAQMAGIGGELQKQYRSWEELAQAFEAGMQAWQRQRGVNDPAQLGRVQKNLPALRQQIWPAVAFDTALGGDD
jgi:hypothetical protein